MDRERRQRPVRVELNLPEDRWIAGSGHIPSLDGIRAVSVIIVFAGHLALPERFVGISALGLDVFFFVSGFLIARLLFAEQKSNGVISLSYFYTRRLLRLYPILIVFMAVALVVKYLRAEPISLLEGTSVVFYFWNYLLAHESLYAIAPTLPIGVLWSLSVEEHFYLIMPIAFLLCNGAPRTILRIVVGICVASLALRHLYFAIWPGLEHTLYVYRHSETRVDSIAFGVLLACLCQTGVGRRLVGVLATRRAFVVGAAILLASFAYRNFYYQNTIRFTIQSLALMPLVSGSVFAQPIPLVNIFLNAAVVRWIGRLSYSLYIWHSGVYFFFDHWLPKQPALSLVVVLACTFFLATLSYYAIERPASRLRGRLHPSRANASFGAITARRVNVSSTSLR